LTPVLLDSSALVALLDRRERSHAVCAELFETIQQPFITCEAVIVESCHLVRRIPGAKDRVLANIAAGVLEIPFRLSLAVPEIRRIFDRYRDRQMDLADACLVHLAEEFNTPDILTLDRDFDVYRWGRNRPFRRLVLLGS
jgi:predicted nucleic acid-binding protein